MTSSKNSSHCIMCVLLVQNAIYPYGNELSAVHYCALLTALKTASQVAFKLRVQPSARTTACAVAVREGGISDIGPSRSKEHSLYSGIYSIFRVGLVCGYSRRVTIAYSWAWNKKNQIMKNDICFTGVDSILKTIMFDFCFWFLRRQKWIK